MDTGIGYRFHPSDVELVDHYLRQKMFGNDDEVWQIAEINVLGFEPWELPGKSIYISFCLVNSVHSIMLSNPNDQVWYFFCTPNYKYSNSKRVDRTTTAGYWKVTGKDRKIKDIAIKKTLVFYQGRPKGVRTNWIMHEYIPTFDFPTERDFVICKIKRNADSEDPPNFEEGEPSTAIAAYTENHNYYSTFEGEELTRSLESGSGNYATEVRISSMTLTRNKIYKYAIKNKAHQVSTLFIQEDTQVQAYVQSFHGYDEKDYNLDSAFQWPNNYYY
ncbi:hypothetical protein RCOM_1340970 [Ricinus communis]|uniref:NAC domain-containing protein n=1 Tax=Ricinus communis TaxID=3988 RepID=B9RMW6_RICCO|nr:hypothetical protein RCOM_1340970 [Ricinus communis]